MAKLFGAQRLVLQAIHDLPKDAAGYVSDAQVARATQIAEADVREWLDTLDGEGLVEVARTTAGLNASITAKGKLQLGLYKPISSSHGGEAGGASLEPPQPAPPPDALTESVTAPTTGPPTTAIPSPPIPTSVAPASPSVAGETVDGFQVVLLIHGIRAEADWGPMVRSKLEVPGRVEVIPIRYGYLDAFRFWFPLWTRSKPVEKVYVQIRVALQKYRREHPDAKLSIVAHSFGTYVVGQILKRGFDLKIHRLILCGSVLPQDFPWEQYQGRFDDDKVVNECGKADIWPVLAQSMSWGYGASGTHGFGAVLVKDRFHSGGHGQYFEPGFVEKYWEPFIRRGEYRGTDFEKTMPPTPWWLSMLKVLSVKLAILILLAAITAWLVVFSELIGPLTSNQYQPKVLMDWRVSDLDQTGLLNIDSVKAVEDEMKEPSIDIRISNKASGPIIIDRAELFVKKIGMLKALYTAYEPSNTGRMLPSAKYRFELPDRQVPFTVSADVLQLVRSSEVDLFRLAPHITNDGMASETKDTQCSIWSIVVKLRYHYGGRPKFVTSPPIQFVSGNVVSILPPVSSRRETGSAKITEDYNIRFNYNKEVLQSIESEESVKTNLLIDIKVKYQRSSKK